MKPGSIWALQAKTHSIMVHKSYTEGVLNRLR